MGKYDIFIFGGLAAAAGYYLFVMNPDLIGGLIPKPVDGEPEPEPTGNGGGDGEEDGKDGGGSGNGGYDCKKACKNCWCKSYNEKCGGSCSKCCGGSRIASKCGGKGVKKCTSSGGGGGGGSSGSDVDAGDEIEAGAFSTRAYSYPYGNDMRLSIA